MLTSLANADSHHMQESNELRANIARSLQGRAAAIVNDASGVYPFAGMENVAADDRARLAELAFQLLTNAVRDGVIDSHHAVVADLRQLAAQKEMGIRLLFTVVYLVERSALDELALDESFRVASEPWPALTQIVRQASLDVCATLAEHTSRGAFDGAITDSLTTLHTRPVFLAALEKEIQRSERFGHPFALILLDVDRLADINARHGYGSGDRVLERIGIVVRNYFRETDWVARLIEDKFAILLPETQVENAERLADNMRATVQERLHLHDYRSEQQFPVTVSVGILIATSVDQSVRAERLLADLEAAVDRAKKAGGNRLERADAIVGGSSAPARDTMPID